MQILKPQRLLKLQTRPVAPDGRRAHPLPYIPSQIPQKRLYEKATSSGKLIDHLDEERQLFFTFVVFQAETQRAQGFSTGKERGLAKRDFRLVWCGQ